MSQDAVELALYMAVLSIMSPPTLLRPFLDHLAQDRLFTLTELQHRCADNEKLIQTRLRNSKRVREELLHVFASQTVEPRHLDSLETLIASFENKAARDASEMSFLMSAFEKRVLALSGGSGQGELFDAYQILERHMQTELDEMFDFILLLRNIWSTFAPDSRALDLSDDQRLERLTRLLMLALSPP